MKALVKTSPSKGLDLIDVPEPSIGSHDVCIKVLKTGICGTDLHIFNWDTWAQRTIPVPMVVGHEFVGTVEDVGSEVKSFKRGDIVSGEGHLVCGRCRNCLAGRRHLCAHTIGVGVNRTGAFAEYIAIPEANVWYHDQNVNLDVASIFDPFGNAVHTALSFPILGEDVLITGAGPIGVMATAIARHAGARYVVVSDPNSYRRDLAMRMGATCVVDPMSEDFKTIQKKLGMTEGFDVGLEMSGNENAFKAMVQNMCHGGKIALLGIPGDHIGIDWNKVVFNMLVIKGIYGREMFDTWYKMTVMLQSGLDISHVITHRLHFTEYMKGFEVMNSGNSGKVILNWE